VEFGDEVNDGDATELNWTETV